MSNITTTIQDTLNTMTDGDGFSWITKLSKLGDVLNDQLGDWSDQAILLLGSLRALSCASNEEIDAMSDQDFADVFLEDVRLGVMQSSMYNSLLNRYECTIGNLQDGIALRVEENVHERLLYIGNVLVGVWSEANETWTSVYRGAAKTIVTLAGIPFNLSTSLIDRILSGKSMIADYAAIIKQAVLLPWFESFDSAMLTFREIIANAISLSAEARAEILSAAVAGPMSLINYFQTLYNELSQAASRRAAGDNDPFSSSLSIVVNEFSGGVVLSLVSTVVSLASSIALLCGGVITKIVGIIGIVASYIMNFIRNVTEHAADVTYRVSTQGNIGFSFVVNRCTVTSRQLCDTILATGATGATYQAPDNPSIILCYVLDANTATVIIEEHLSANYNLLKIMKKLTYNNTPKYMLGFDFSEMSGNSYSYGRYILPATYKDGQGDVIDDLLCPAAFTDVAATNLAHAAYSPLSFSLWDKIVSKFSDPDVLDGNIEIRLASSAMIWALIRIGLIFSLVQRYDEDNPGTLPNNYYVSMFHCDMASSVFNTHNQFIVLKNLALRAMNAILTCVNNLCDATYDFTAFHFVKGTNHDNLIASIKNTFNQLNWTEDPSLLGTSGNLSTLSLKVISESDAIQAGYEFSHLSGSISTPTIVVADLAPLLSQTPTICSRLKSFIDGSWFSVGYYGNGRLYQGFDNEFTCRLPSGTFAGYLAGLIVDGLIVVALAATAVTALVIRSKIRNYRAKLMANTEAYWYRYQATVTDPSATAADSQATWSSYKSNRIKYNVLSAFTGGGSMSLEYSGDYSGGIVPSLINRYSDGTADIQRIIKLIAG